MQPHPLALEPLCLLDVGARQAVDIAARAGFDFVSMVLQSPAPMLPVDPIVRDVTLRREAIAAMKTAGIRMHNIECFNLRPDARFEEFAEALAVGQELGARSATAIAMPNGDRADLLAKFRGLCDMAAEMGIRVNVEFFAMSPDMCSLDMAVAFVRDSGRANAGVMIDVLHLIRTGSSVEAMRLIDPDLIGGCQICDGPLLADSATVADEAGANRLVPGVGEFPLRAFIAALPADMVIGVEVPQARLIGKVPPEERARVLAEAMRGLFIA